MIKMSKMLWNTLDMYNFFKHTNCTLRERLNMENYLKCTWKILYFLIKCKRKYLYIRFTKVHILKRHQNIFYLNLFVVVVKLGMSQ